MAEIITDACPNFNGSAHDNSHLPFVPEQLWGAHLHPLKKLGSFKSKKNEDTGKWEPVLDQDGNKIPQEKVPNAWTSNPAYVELTDEERSAKKAAGEKIEPKGWGWGGSEPKLTKRDKRYGVCLTRSRLFVLDIDTHGVDGNETLRDILAKLGIELDTFTVSTGTGGFHYYFQLPEELAADPITKATNLWPGVDIFPQNQQVVGPGSTRTLKDGTIGRYEVSNDAPISEVPTVLLQAIRDRIAETKAEEDAKRAAATAERQAKRAASMGLSYSATDGLSESREEILDRMLGDLRNATPGNRHDEILRRAFNAGAFFGADEGIRSQVIQAAIESGHDEAERAASEAFDEGALEYEPWIPPTPTWEKRRTAASPTRNASRDDATAQSDRPALPTLDSFFFSDIGMTEYFEACNAHRFKAVEEWNGWATYDESTGLWRPVGAAYMLRFVSDWYANEVYPEVMLQISKMPDDTEENRKIRDSLTKAAKKFTRKIPCRDVVELSFGKLLESSSCFDDNPDMILTPSGAVDLRTGKLRKPRAEDNFLTSTTAEYEKGYKDPRFDAILSSFSPEVADFLQVIMGNALTNHPLHRDRIFFQTGDGANGKSMTTDIFKTVMGGYANKVSSKLLLRDGGDDQAVMASLKGLRCIFMEELPESNWLNSKAVKDLTEASEITARALYKMPETFEFNATKFVNTNFIPQVSEADHGTWRRLALIPMPYTYVSQAEYDAEPNRVAKKLRVGREDLKRAKKDPSVLKAALAWMVDGAVRWYEAGMTEPSEPRDMDDARTTWKGGQDKIELWASEMLVADADSFCLVPDLHETYEKVMTEYGRTAEKSRKFMEIFKNSRIFKDANATYIQNGTRATSLSQKHSPYTPEKRSNSPFEPEPTAREPKGARFYVIGFRFKTDADITAEEEADLEAAKKAREAREAEKAEQEKAKTDVRFKEITEHGDFIDEDDFDYEDMEESASADVDDDIFS